MQVTRFIYADKAKDVKRLLFSPQYIEHKISTFNEIFNRMKEQKNLSYSLRKVYRVNQQVQSGCKVTHNV